jgi:hypothetical protein
MGIPFLKVLPEDAAIQIQKQAEKGYSIKYAMTGEHDSVGGPSGVTDTMVTEWIKRMNDWSHETRLILLKVYESPNYMYKFLETTPNVISIDSEERRYTNLKHQLVERIEALNSFVDFIIQNSNPTFTTGDNIKTQINLYPKRDINIAGRNIKTE